MSKADQYYSELAWSKHRLNYIGKMQEHLGDTGSLSKVTVKTTIHYQPNAGASNYHDDDAFDSVLAEVIMEKFDELAERAIAKMQYKADKALLKEEEELKQRLEKIAQLKEASV